MSTRRSTRLADPRGALCAACSPPLSAPTSDTAPSGGSWSPARRRHRRRHDDRLPARVHALRPERPERRARSSTPPGGAHPWAPTTSAATCGRASSTARGPSSGWPFAAALGFRAHRHPAGPALRVRWAAIFDRVLSLVMDSVYSFPGLILAIAFAAMLGPGVVNITLAVAVVYIPTYFRLVRGQTLSIKEEVYVEAARAIGARRRHDPLPLHLPQRDRHGRRDLLAEHRGRDHDRGGPLLHRPRPARGHPGLGHGPLHGQEVPALRGLVDDHVPRAR